MMPAHEHKIHVPHGTSGTNWDNSHWGDSDPLYYKAHHHQSKGLTSTTSTSAGNDKFRFTSHTYFDEYDAHNIGDNVVVGKEVRPTNVTVKFWRRTV